LQRYRRIGPLFNNPRYAANRTRSGEGSGLSSTTVYVATAGGRADELPPGDGLTSVYIGNYYEKEGNTTRTYYYHNGQRVAVLKTWRVAVREKGASHWLLSEQLGSTAVVLDAGGTVIGERR
jgi:hypothetical protein